jgi:polyisoprenoid-binding protein YceI/rhodanese-related sulfurtransferase
MEARSRIAPQTLKSWLDEGRTLTILDTLPPEYFARRHLPGAMNACVYEVVFPERLAELLPDKAATVVVYGSSHLSKAGEVAADKLARLGYSQVFELDGGLAAWQAANLPLAGLSPGDASDEHSDFRLPARNFRLDIDLSVLTWQGRNHHNTHTGSLKLSEGALSWDGHSGVGRFVIDLATLADHDLADRDLNALLIRHLLSEDFLFAERHPTATFDLTSLTPIPGAMPGEPSFSAQGLLTVRGVRAELEFPVTVSPLEDGSISFEAHFDWDRVRWGVAYGSGRLFRHLGMHLVYGPVSIALRLVAR